MKLAGKLGVRLRLRPDGEVGVTFVHYGDGMEEFFSTGEHVMMMGDELLVSPVYLIDVPAPQGGITIEWALARQPPAAGGARP